jgi:DNA-binding CsgD family transcriptional regulator
MSDMKCLPAMLDIKLLYRLSLAANVEALTAVVSDAVVELGAPGFFCTIRCDRPYVEPIAWAFSSNALWAEQYLGLPLGASDNLLPTDISQNGVSRWTLSGTETAPSLHTAICEQAQFRSGMVARVSQDPVWKMALVCAGPDAQAAYGPPGQAEGLEVLSVALMHYLIVRIMPAQLNASLPKISRREMSCLSWAARGYTASDIALKLEISEPTVVFHMNNLIRKLGVKNRTQAIAVGVAKGLTN